MTILANTATHLVEYEAGLLTIARRTDGFGEAVMRELSEACQDY